MNALYAISCAHKIGCTVFAVWEDLVEVRPKMVMVLLAATMKIALAPPTVEPDGLADRTRRVSSLQKEEAAADRGRHYRAGPSLDDLRFSPGLDRGDVGATAGDGDGGQIPTA